MIDKNKPIRILLLFTVMDRGGAETMTQKTGTLHRMRTSGWFDILIAVLVLFYVSNWMVSKAESDAWSKYIDDQVKVSTETGSALTLGFTAFLAVFREGAEVILFYQPLISSSNGNVFPVWLGFGVGCVCLVFVYIIIRFFSVKLPIRPFFLGTSILMFVMSISFLGSGIKELIEGDVISYTSPELLANLIPVNDVFDVLGIYPCFETLIPQLILILITLMIFVLQKWKTKNKNEAGVLAIVMGGLGIHKFYLGKYGQGLSEKGLQMLSNFTVILLAHDPDPKLNHDLCVQRYAQDVAKLRHFKPGDTRFAQVDKQFTAYSQGMVAQYLDAGMAHDFQGDLHKSFIRDAPRGSYSINGQSFPYTPDRGPDPVINAFTSAVKDPKQRKVLSAFMSQLTGSNPIGLSQGFRQDVRQHHPLHDRYRQRLRQSRWPLRLDAGILLRLQRRHAQACLRKNRPVHRCCDRLCDRAVGR